MQFLFNKFHIHFHENMQTGSKVSTLCYTSNLKWQINRETDTWKS